MYIDIFLALVLMISMYMLRRRVFEKIPDLRLIPDQDISILLEENTAKLQRFFLHIFHFQSFYRERHYHEKFRSFITKLLFKGHIALLRIDNSIMRLMKRMRVGNEMEIEQRHDAREYFTQLQESSSSLSISEKVNRVQEVRIRRRTRSTKTLEPQKTEVLEARLASDRTLL